MRYMKYISIIILALFFYACEETSMPLFNAENSFVFIESSAYTIAENTTGVLEVPVVVGSVKGSDVEVTFEVAETGTNPAVEGTDYQILNSGGKVTITDGCGTGVIQIKPINNDVYGKDKTFKITLKSNTAGFYMNTAEDGNTVATITISDDEHPLAIILGEYKEIDYILSDGSTEGPYDVVISPVDGSETQVSIYNFWGGGDFSIIADVDVEAKTISIGAGQVIYVHSTYGDCKAVWINLEAGAYAPSDPIPGTFDDAGNITVDAWAARVSAGSFENYSKSILTKQ